MRILRNVLAVAGALVLATPVVDLVAPGSTLSTAFAATGAGAGPVDDPDEDGDPTAAAKKASSEAVAAYKAGKYVEAIAAWTRAFELVGKDSYLFNIAKAYEKLGEKGEAARYYAKYAALTSDAKRKAKAEKKVEELGGAPASAPVDAASDEGVLTPDLGEGESEGEGDEASPESLEAPAELDDDDDDSSIADMVEPEPEKKKLAPFPFVTLGVGVAGIAVGVVFGQLARMKAGELEDLACSPGASSCAPFNDKDSEAFRIHDTGKMFNTLQIVGYVMGGVFVATGLTLFVAGSAGKDDVRAGSAGPGVTASVTPVIGPGAVGASARLTF